ncbi:MAG: outer membrane beta-barrel protein [Verrucomicrobiota bacterium]
MRLFTFAKFGLIVAALSLFCFQPAIIRAEDEQGTPTTEDAVPTPSRETPNFIENRAQSTTGGETPAPTAGETPAPAPGETPAPAAGSTSTHVTSRTQEINEGGVSGTGVFSRLPFHLSASLSAGYDDNVLTTRVPGSASLFVSPNAGINYKFADPRTNVTLQVNAGLTYYFDRSSLPTPTPPPFGTPAPTPSLQDYDVSVAMGLSVTHKASARLTLSLTANVSYQTEPDFSANVGNNRRTGNYFYSSDRLSALYQWLPRFSTNTSYNLSVVRYDDTAFGTFLDRSEHTLGNEFRFLLWPMTTVIAEARVLFVTYDKASGLDSMTELLLAGFEHKFTPRFSVGLRGGAQFRSFDSGSDRTEPYFESTLNYAAGRRTTVSWFTRYALEEPSVSGSASVTTFRTGLQTKYEIAPRVSTTIGLFYVRDDYPAGPPVTIFPGFTIPGPPAFVENSVDVNLGLRYEVNRNFGIDVGYGHTEVTSGQAAREYSRNRYFGGVNLTF